MTVEIISWSISTKVWDRAGIELATPGSEVRLTSVARHVTDCATLSEFESGMRLAWSLVKVRSLSYMERLIMDCFSPTFPSFLSEHKTVYKTWKSTFYLFDFNQYISLSIILNICFMNSKESSHQDHSFEYTQKNHLIKTVLLSTYNIYVLVEK